MDAIKSWNVNAVRVPLNEDCWLNINGINHTYAGDNYKAKIKEYVDLLTASDMAVILDLHWAAPGAVKADHQLPMPNKDHSIPFWQDCARFFSNYTNVILDLFNEPFPGLLGGICTDYCTDLQWQCWRDGGKVCRETDLTIYYDAAGMQDLVNATRSVGSNHILMLGGLAWSNSLSKWDKFVPYDTKKQLAVSWHSYNFNYLSREEQWDKFVAPLAKKYPIITGEIGENDCQPKYINNLMAWCDRHNISYLGWTWTAHDCKGAPALITDYDGTPTAYGIGLRDHLKNKRY